MFLYYRLHPKYKHLWDANFNMLYLVTKWVYFGNFCDTNDVYSIKFYGDELTYFNDDNKSRIINRYYQKMYHHICKELFKEFCKLAIPSEVPMSFNTKNFSIRDWVDDLLEITTNNIPITYIFCVMSRDYLKFHDMSQINLNTLSDKKFILKRYAVPIIM